MDAKTIRAARDAHDHTQSKAAAIVGVTLRSWQRWEDLEGGGCPSTSPDAVRRALAAYIEESGVDAAREEA